MGTYAIDSRAIAAHTERAAERSAAREGPELAAQLRAGKALEDEALAALFLSEDVSTDELLELARECREVGAGTSAIETFAPLYLTNECDGECLMCGMRRLNRDLKRETADEDTVRHNLSGLDDIEFHRGWIPERFAEVADRRFSLAHVDVDLYQPTLESMEFFYPRLSAGGILVCDDYGSRKCPGAYKAVNEFMADKPEGVLHLPTGQSLVYKQQGQRQ